jgi:hypothetical protein
MGNVSLIPVAFAACEPPEPKAPEAKSEDKK